MIKISKDNSNTLPILYTFRRCPYAMRARLAIELSGLKIEYREILLRDKPKPMLDASPKGTVPVLVVNSKTLIDESLDIIFWVLQQSDPDNFLDSNVLNMAKKLIMSNDLEFKPKLDCYKYAERFPEKSVVDYRDDCLAYLQQLNVLLQKNQYLLGSKLCIADIAIYPFIRQFAFVDKNWFDSTKYDHLKKWLYHNLESDLFKKVMIKRAIWVQ